LVEILVTITIILVLAALTTVGTKKLRAGADTVTALKRVGGLAQANAMFALENGGKYVPCYASDLEGKTLPPWHANRAFFEPLIGDNPNFDKAIEYESVEVPEQLLDPVVVRAKKLKWNETASSFAYNQENMPGGGFGGKGTTRAHTTTSLQNPSETFAFISATDWVGNYGGRFLWKKSPVEGRTANSKIAYRHQDKAVVAFYDGHTETLSIKDMQKFDRNGGINNVFWGGTMRGGK
jgi:prepilin-type processing-associated H-X9-DG protein